MPADEPEGEEPERGEVFKKNPGVYLNLTHEPFSWTNDDKSRWDNVHLVLCSAAVDLHHMGDHPPPRLAVLRFRGVKQREPRDSAQTRDYPASERQGQLQSAPSQWLRALPSSDS